MLLLESSARVVTVLFILQDWLGLVEVWDFSTNKTRMCQPSFRSFECMDVIFINCKSIRALVVI